MPLGESPTLAMLDAELVHLVDDPLHGVGVLVDDVGHVLEHVLRGELHLLHALGVLEVGAEEVVGGHLLLDRRVGEADPEVDDPDVGRHGHPVDTSDAIRATMSTTSSGRCHMGK